MKNRAPRTKLTAARARRATALDALVHPQLPHFVGPHETARDAANAAAAEHFGLPYAKSLPGCPLVGIDPQPDPHEALSQAVDALIAVMNAVGRGDARAGGKAAKVTAVAVTHEAIKDALRRTNNGHLLERPYRERSIAQVFKQFAALRRIEGLPTAQAFVRRLRGRTPQ